MFEKVKKHLPRITNPKIELKKGNTKVSTQGGDPCGPHNWP